ncbi:MAG: hypothetical protein ACK41E_04645 [Deinococcales bacterium]
MKRCLVIVLAVLTLQTAQAAEYFGIRGELLFPFSGGSASAWALPQVGVQFGVDFPEVNFGFRASASTLVVAYRLALDGYYVLPIQNFSSAYFGLGVGLVGSFVGVAGLQSGQALAEVRGVVGYQSGVGGLGGRFFFELIPSFIPALNGGTFGLTVGLGFNFR